MNVYFKFGIDHPNGFMLVLTNITSHNQVTSWKGSGSILALLPGYAGTGYYGVCCDFPYLQTSVFPIISHNDDMRSRSTLDFEFLSTGTLADGIVSAITPALMRNRSASLVFWSVEPERLLPRHDHFHTWLSTENQS